MRAFKLNGRLFQPLLAALLFTSIVPNRLLADDKETSNPSAKSAEAKSDSPAPGLTERERLLLDRVEQLERRVAELETKSNSTAAAVAAAPSSKPGLLNPTASTAVASAASVPPVPAAAEASANFIPAEKVLVSVHPQAAEKGKPGAVKAPAAEPFAFADFTWMTGNPRTKDIPYDTKFFTPEFRVDANYVYDFNYPKDDTIGGSSEVFRSNEVHVTDIGVGGDFHYNNVRGGILSQIGLYSQTTARNDASPARGQWSLADAYR